MHTKQGIALFEATKKPQWGESHAAKQTELGEMDSEPSCEQDILLPCPGRPEPMGCQLENPVVQKHVLLNSAPFKHF